MSDIVIALANGLVNWGAKQDEQGVWDTTAHLESLTAEYPDMLDIVIALARGLANLSIKQDEQGVRDSIARLESLAA